MSGSLLCDKGFFDPIEGGTCWSCPSGFNRTVGPAVTAADACRQALTPIAAAGDFPPKAASKKREQRVNDCKAEGEPKCYAQHKAPTTAGIPSNCLYGWNVGKGHPESNSNPPSYDKLLNALDQCAWFHDRGAWRYNVVTNVCEKWEMCSNSMGLKRCLERYQPNKDDKAAIEAKACFTNFFAKAMEACVPSLYKDWGAEHATDSNGDSWLSARSVAELRGAMKQCPSENQMRNPGFPGT
jgi:hypothetical protein